MQVFLSTKMRNKKASLPPLLYTTKPKTHFSITHFWYFHPKPKMQAKKACIRHQTHVVEEKKPIDVHFSVPIIVPMGKCKNENEKNNHPNTTDLVGE